MDNITRERIDINLLRLLYNRYKAFIVPFLVIVVVVIVFIKFNVPSIADLFKSYEEQKSAKLTLQVMRNNLNLLKQMESLHLDSQFKVVSKALPIDKDFYSILNTLSDVSNKSGVQIEGFKFAVGSLSKDEVESEYPTLSLSVNLAGKVMEVDNFMNKLAKALPLSEIVKISSDMDAIALTIDFYYKPLKTSMVNNEAPIGQISNNGISLIENIATLFTLTPGFDESQLPVSSPSANPFF